MLLGRRNRPPDSWKLQSQRVSQTAPGSPHHALTSELGTRKVKQTLQASRIRTETNVHTDRSPLQMSEVGGRGEEDEGRRWLPKSTVGAPGAGAGRCRRFRPIEVVRYSGRDTLFLFEKSFVLLLFRKPIFRVTEPKLGTPRRSTTTQSSQTETTTYSLFYLEV